MNIVLPFPPSVNSMYGGGSKQQRFPSKKYKAWIVSCPTLPQTKLDAVNLTYKYYFPDLRERDSENYIKAVTDMLVKQQVIVNDSWQYIKSMLVIPAGVDRINPRVEITIDY